MSAPATYILSKDLAHILVGPFPGFDAAVSHIRKLETMLELRDTHIEFLDESMIEGEVIHCRWSPSADLEVAQKTLIFLEVMEARNAH
jgi:hypothetical protein